MQRCSSVLAKSPGEFPWYAPCVHRRAAAKIDSHSHFFSLTALPPPTQPRRAIRGVQCQAPKQYEKDGREHREGGLCVGYCMKNHWGDNLSIVDTHSHRTRARRSLARKWFSTGRRLRLEMVIDRSEHQCLRVRLAYCCQSTPRAADVPMASGLRHSPVVLRMIFWTLLNTVHISAVHSSLNHAQSRRGDVTESVRAWRFLFTAQGDCRGLGWHAERRVLVEGVSKLVPVGTCD